MDTLGQRGDHVTEAWCLQQHPNAPLKGWAKHGGADANQRKPEKRQTKVLHGLYVQPAVKASLLSLT